MFRSKSQYHADTPRPRQPVLRLCAAFVLVAACAAIGLYHLSRSSTVQITGDIVARGPEDRPRVALTLDDGPSGAYTQDVLDVLKAYDVKATFFLVGNAMEAKPEALAAIIAAGHEIGNHSYAHQRLILKSRATLRADLERTDEIIRGAGYTGPIQFRAPYGMKLLNLPRVLKEQGRASIMWSNAPEKVARSEKTEEAQVAAMIEAAVSQTSAGEIILLHPMYKSRATTRAALPAILEGLKARGFEFVGVSELLGD